MSPLRTFAVEHKDFVLSYFFSIAFSAILLAGALGVGVYAARPVEQKTVAVAVEAVKAAVPQSVQFAVSQPVKTLQELEFENAKTPANLTKAQWIELRQFLSAWRQSLSGTAAFPDEKPTDWTFGKVSHVISSAIGRAHIVAGYSHFVLEHYETLPQEAKDDWTKLAALSTSTDWYSNIDEHMSYVESQFVSSTLSVDDVSIILRAHRLYEEQRTYVIQSSQYIDHLLPILAKAGLQIQPNEPPGGSVIDYSAPRADLKSYIEAVGDSSPGFSHTPVVPPPSFPPITFTMRQVIDQLDQPPLSVGANSAERASK